MLLHRGCQGFEKRKPLNFGEGAHRSVHFVFYTHTLSYYTLNEGEFFPLCFLCYKSMAMEQNNFNIPHISFS